MLFKLRNGEILRAFFRYVERVYTVSVNMYHGSWKYHRVCAVTPTAQNIASTMEAGNIIESVQYGTVVL